VAVCSGFPLGRQPMAPQPRSAVDLKVAAALPREHVATVAAALGFAVPVVVVAGAAGAAAGDGVVAGAAATAVAVTAVAVAAVRDDHDHAPLGERGRDLAVHRRSLVLMGLGKRGRGGRRRGRVVRVGRIQPARRWP
jgi:hypothetical protein